MRTKPATSIRVIERLNLEERENERKRMTSMKSHEKIEQKKMRMNEMPKARQEHQERLDGEYTYIYI